MSNLSLGIGLEAERPLQSMSQNWALECEPPGNLIAMPTTAMGSEGLRPICGPWPDMAEGPILAYTVLCSKSKTR